jgi:hypothetical protein
MLRMQEMAFQGFKFHISQKGTFKKNPPPPSPHTGKSLKKALTSIPKKAIKCLFTY